MKRFTVIALLAACTLSCSKRPSTTDVHFRIEEFPPQAELLRRVQEHDGPENPFIFTFPYLLFKLSSGEEFGHTVEGLGISFKGETNVTTLVCDSIPWTKPVGCALSSHGTVDFDLADMQSGKIMGQFSIGLKNKLIKRRH